jgi:hypothetical protein
MILVVAIQCGAVAVGYALGLYCATYRVYSLQHWQLLAGAAGALLAAGVIAQRATPATSGRGVLLSVVALAYCAGFVALERYGVELATGLYPAAAALLPLLAVVGPLVRDGAWYSTAGVAVFIVACVGLMAYNANAIGTWNGFTVSYRT